jgi:hypothetical protein
VVFSGSYDGVAKAKEFRRLTKSKIKSMNKDVQQTGKKSWCSSAFAPGEVIKASHVQNTI